MAVDEALPLEGACTCSAVRYRMTSKPMFVHCCHCRSWVVLPADTPAVAEYYDRNAHWPGSSLERRRVLLAKVNNQ